MFPNSRNLAEVVQKYQQAKLERHSGAFTTSKKYLAPLGPPVVLVVKILSPKA